MYQVFRVESLGAPRNHHAIFVEIDKKNESGFIFQVTGNIQNGMTYEVKQDRKIEDSDAYIARLFLGWIDPKNYSLVDEICRRIPPPKKQFHGPQRLYPREPLRRCQEWTQEAIQALENGGVLRRAPS